MESGSAGTHSPETRWRIWGAQTGGNRQCTEKERERMSREERRELKVLRRPKATESYEQVEKVKKGEGG